MWETILFAFEQNLVVDPSLEEMFVSNNLLSVTVFENGKQLIDKSLSLRTLTG